MKKMKNPEKVFKGLLVCAMGVVLCGVTLSKANATYFTYAPTIQVEHVWQQTENGVVTDPSKGAYPNDEFVKGLEHQIKDEALAEGADGIIKLSPMESAKELTEQVKNVIVTDTKNQFDNVKKLHDQMTEEPPEPEEGADEAVWAEYTEKKAEYDAKKAEYDATYESVKETLVKRFIALGKTEEEATKAVGDVFDTLDNTEIIGPDWTAFEALVNEWKVPEKQDDDTSGEGGDTAADPVKFEDFAAQMKEELQKLELKDDEISNVLNTVAEALGNRTNRDDLTLDIDSLEVINVQTTDVKEELLKGESTILNPLDLVSASKLEEAGYENSLKITIMVIQKDKWEDDSAAVAWVSVNDGETWVRADGSSTEPVENPLQEGDIIKSYLYTYLHVKDTEPEPDPDPTPTPTPTPTPEPTPEPSDPPEDPDEELPEPELPLGEIELEDPEIPQTGDISFLWYGMVLVSAAGLMILALEDRRNKKTA